MNRGPLGALAVLAVPFAVLVLVWAAREPPTEPCSGAEPASVRAAWLAGLGPAAFAAGCYCAIVIVWLSARTRGGDPSRSTVVAVAAGLAAAGAWWAGGEPVAGILWWPVLAYVLVFPSLLVVAGLVYAIAFGASEASAWRLLPVLAWLGAIVLIPGFVAHVDMSGTDVFC